METITVTLRRQEEHPQTWRYCDESIGSLYLLKSRLPDDPPEKLTVTIEETSDE